MTQGSLERSLTQVLLVLRPYLDDVVIIGGWVPYLYRAHGGFPQWTGRLSYTAEVDLLLPTSAPARERPSLSELLVAAGFVDTAEGAVWERETATVERLELLVGNTGPQSSEGKPAAVEGQAGVTAIALDDLRLLGKYTQELVVPIPDSGDATPLVRIRVPTLGGYVLNKSLTFPKRLDHMHAGKRVPNLKRGKDLVYVHDVLAGGGTVAKRVETDLTAIARRDAHAKARMRNGASHLRIVLRDRSPETWGLAVQILREREGLDSIEASESLAGYLHDAAEILEECGGGR
jgi:hypothetical protein